MATSPILMGKRKRPPELPVAICLGSSGGLVVGSRTRFASVPVLLPHYANDRDLISQCKRRNVAVHRLIEANITATVAELEIMCGGVSASEPDAYVFRLNVHV